MTTYLLTCKCGIEIPVETTNAGDALTCECGENILVPNLRQVKLLPPAQSQEARVARSWSLSHGILFCVAIVLLGIGMSTAAVAFYQGQQFDTDDTTEEMTIYGHQVIDQMPPLESIEVWKLIRDNGLREQQLVKFVIARENQAEYYYYGYLGLSVAAAGFVLISITTITRRGRKSE